MHSKILIVDGSYEYRRALEAALCTYADVMVCDNGVQALDHLYTFQPDYLVLDLMITGIDGIFLLKKLWEERKLPPTVVTSIFFSRPVTEALERMGIGCAISKPYRPGSIVSALEDLMASSSGEPDLSIDKRMVSGVLMELGFRVSHSGYRYCRDAVVMLMKDPSLRVTKDIYHPLAKEANCQKESVEKCIRDAITIAWKAGDKQVWGRYFSSPEVYARKPSNRVFLCAVAEYLNRMLPMAQ